MMQLNSEATGGRHHTAGVGAASSSQVASPSDEATDPSRSRHEDTRDCSGVIPARFDDTTGYDAPTTPRQEA